MRGLIHRLVPRSNATLAVGFLATVSLLGLFAAIWVTFCSSLRKPGFYWPTIWNNCTSLYEPDLSIHRGMKASQDSVDFRREIAEQLANIAKELRAPERNGLGDIVLRLSRIVSRLDPRYELSDEDAIPGEPRNSSANGGRDDGTGVNPEARQLGPEWDGDGKDLVCDEHYLGERHGYPFFDTGFVAKGGCGGEQPLHLVVTVLLVLESEGDERRLETILNGVKSYNPQMTVLAAVPRLTESLKQLVENVGNAVLYEYGVASPGEAWNMLASHAVTPFILFARGVTHFHPTHSRLRRQIRVLSGAVVVAGGAARNEEGKWNMGCLQSQIRGYALRYTRGYRISARDCMICDHLEGPFVTRTYLLRTHPFSQVNSKTDHRFSFLEAVTFADWFLRLKQAGFLTLGCPDVMYYILSGTAVNKGPTDYHAAWLWLAIQWELTAIIYPPLSYSIGAITPKSITFSCGEVGLSCKVSKLANKGYLVPPCCARQVVAALRALDRFSFTGGNPNSKISQGQDLRKLELRYELEAGSILGAVKMGSFIPWDIDGDATFESKDFPLYVKGKSWFKGLGFYLSSFEDPVPMHKESPETSVKTRGYFCLNTPDIYIEMWGYHNLSTDMISTPEADSERNESVGTRPWRSLPEPNMPPTRIHLKTVGDSGGVWARVITNPGLYARNRYGPRFLRHAQSWVNLGLGDSWQSYAASAGDWLRGSQCSRTYHHACLVHYPTDGNLNFYDDDGM